ncbi:hypothetical protein [Evansella cellulosilytica]|uniref:Uncharacterized protein n=1 Tax=Evansella cellulosilytica (strain ATCC 21833 / DSM 2522 / FERM P-1141 / JCM 9156 / N-4) TaxID=649639 RepID=E6TVS4_EVAC2|nr:hypothetical protein [Evansella cellulosilytica]ADU32202.1 hypothetical protein Bcell_3969 [Evansella cellulosilytica DSM 2522]
MPELVRNNEEIFIVIYCFIILWINISYIRDFKNIQKGLSEINSEDELDINPNSISIMLFSLMFSFFRRWMIYILAVLITENIFVLMISVVLFVISLYDSLYNSRLEKLKKSNVGFYLAIVDTIFITIFAIYLFVV